MDPTAYRQFVARHEALAKSDPARLRRRGLAFVALGYAVVLGILAVVVALIVGSAYLALQARGGAAFFVKVVIFAGALGIVVVRALWVKVMPPEGQPLDLATVPRLAERIEGVRQALRAPRPAVVLITPDFNASVTQVPRLGIFGWHRTYLSLGLPLMYGVDGRQFDAVLAHEFAHLSAAHPKTGLWIHRVSATWALLLTQLEQSGGYASRIFRRFFKWYVPRLQALGFVMSRQDEYDADRDAAAIAGARSLGAALVALEIRGRTLDEEFWGGVWRQAEHAPVPPEAVWRAVPGVLAHSISDARGFDDLLRRKALPEETHPSLAERLRALGQLEGGRMQPGLIALLEAPLSKAAADHYMPRVAARLLAELDERWHADVAEPWRNRHEELVGMRARANELLERERAAPLDVDAAWELAFALDQLGGDAVPWLRRITEERPEHVGAHLVLGRKLLASGDAAGVPLLKRAMALDETLAPDCGATLRHFYFNAGDDAAAESAEWTAFQAGELLEAASDERNDVGKRDTLVAPELDDATLAHIAAVAEGFPRIHEVWVARKVTTHLPQRPMYVIGIASRHWRWNSGDTKDAQLIRDFLDALEVGAFDVLVVMIDAHRGWLMKKLRSAPGVLAYSRGRVPA